MFYVSSKVYLAESRTRALHCLKTKTGGHYASTISVYPDISGHWGDVNQSGRPVYQNVAHEKLLE